jgi:hypothetical protein
MITEAHQSDTRTELARRGGDGIDVTLLWDASTDTVSVQVADERGGESFELVVEPGTNPLDVFRHPYAYAAWRGVDYLTPELRAAA